MNRIWRFATAAAAVAVMSVGVLGGSAGAAGAAVAPYTPVAGSPITVGGVPTMVAFSPSGGLLAVGNDLDSGVAGAPLLSVSGTTLTAVAPAVDPQNPAYGIAFSPSGAVLAGPNFLGASLFSLNGDAATYAAAAGSEGVDAAAFSPNGDLLAVANAFSGDVSLFSVSGTTATSAASAFSSGVATGAGTLSFSPSGKLLAVLDSNGDVSVFSISGTTPTALGSPHPTGSGRRRDRVQPSRKPAGGCQWHRC